MTIKILYDYENKNVLHWKLRIIYKYFLRPLYVYKNVIIVCNIYLIKNKFCSLFKLSFATILELFVNYNA